MRANSETNKVPGDVPTLSNNSSYICENRAVPVPLGNLESRRMGGRAGFAVPDMEYLKVPRAIVDVYLFPQNLAKFTL